MAKPSIAKIRLVLMARRVALGTANTPGRVIPRLCAVLTYEQAMMHPQIVNRPVQASFAPTHLPLELRLGCSVSMIYALVKGALPVDGPPPARPPAPRGKRHRDPQRRFQESWQDGLRDSWGVETGPEALEMATDLLDRPLDSSYELLRPELQELTAIPLPQRPGALQRLRQQAERRYAPLDAGEVFVSWAAPFLQPDAEQCLPRTLPYHVAGWNVIRAGWVLRMALLGGLVRPEQTVALYHRTLRVARACCETWRELIDSFLVGRAGWAGEMGDEGLAFRDAAAACLYRSDLPWANIPLHSPAPQYRVA